MLQELQRCRLRAPADREAALDVVHVEIGEAILGALVDHIADELHAFGRIVPLDVGEERAESLAVRAGGEHERDDHDFALKRTQAAAACHPAY